MVYRGRPSTGCKACRERKIKCDERPEGCVKCAEKRMICPGYDRNNTDSFFHDETAHVQQQAKKSKAKAIAARDARDAREAQAALTVKDTSPGRDIVYQGAGFTDFDTTPTFPGMYLIGSIVDHGVTFFMSRHSHGIEQPSIHSDFYNAHLSTNGFRPILSASMTALGLAGVANLYKDVSLKQEATRWYLKAIKLANDALSSPKDAKSDATLVAVGILGVYEATHNETSIVAFHNHVRGAASLIKLRGKDIFKSHAGLRMYFHVMNMYMLGLMGRTLPLPAWVEEMNEELAKHLDIKHPRMGYFFLHGAVINLRSQIIHSKTPNLEDIIRRALELDISASSIFKDASEEFNYDKVQCGPRPDVYGNSYHIYPTMLSAQTHNCVRFCRIYIHDIIRNCILIGQGASPSTLDEPKYHDQLLESCRILQESQAGILASIPQFLHDVSMNLPNKANKREHSPSSQTSSPPSTAPNTELVTYWRTASPLPGNSPTYTDFMRKDILGNFREVSPSITENLLGYYMPEECVPVTRLAGAYATSWSLLVAGSMSTATPESRDFTIACLTRVERECGVSQAAWAANVLRFKKMNPSYDEIQPGKIVPRYVPLPLHTMPIPQEYSSSAV